MAMDYKILGMRIRECRRKKKLSQEKLAEQAGISTQYMSQIETAVRKLSLRSFVSITEALEVSSDELLFGSRTVWPREHPGGADGIFGDCTKYERQILEGMIAGAKQVFLENREIFK